MEHMGTQKSPFPQGDSPTDRNGAGSTCYQSQNNYFSSKPWTLHSLMLNSSYEPCAPFPKSTEAWIILSGLWTSSSPRLFWKGLQHPALALKILQSVPIVQEDLARHSPGDRECDKPLMHSHFYISWLAWHQVFSSPKDLMDQL